MPNLGKANDLESCAEVRAVLVFHIVDAASPKSPDSTLQSGHSQARGELMWVWEKTTFHGLKWRGLDAVLPIAAQLASTTSLFYCKIARCTSI